MSTSSHPISSETRDRDKCIDFIKSTLNYNKEARKLVDSIEDLGCKLPKDFFICRTCEKSNISGGFSIPIKGKFYKPQIIVCEDKKLNKNQIANTIVHELVHAYDSCRSKLEFSNCFQRACTEIRASSLSDECGLSTELMRGNFKITGGHKICTERRAKLSLELDPVCKDKADDYIKSVFPSCYNDKSPF